MKKILLQKWIESIIHSTTAYNKIAMIKRISFLLTLLFLFSCNKENGDTKFFKNYLNSCLNLGIPLAKHKFILVSGNGCHGCNASILLHAMHKKDNNDNSYIFSSDIEDEIGKINGYKNIYIDTSDKVNKLKFHGGNSCVMYTSSSKIDSVILMNIGIVDSMLNSIEGK